MGELSDRFAALMARMAKSDADLYRTIGEQNAHVRLMVDELVPPDETTSSCHGGALPAGALLPKAECEQAPLKKRFGKVAEAQAWIGGQIGPAPKKPTWAVIVQTCKTGSWPARSTSTAKRANALTVEEFDARLNSMQKHLDQRLERIEWMLTLLADALPTPIENQSSAK